MTLPLPDVPLVTYDLHLGGRSWHIRAASDHDALLAAADAFSVFPFGLILWESAIAIGVALVAAPPLVCGKRVLELGAGVGLAGLMAASLGARVTQTDHAPEALSLAIANAEANGVRNVDTFAADWGQWQHIGHYDVIIGADILYERAVHAPLLAIFAANLAPGGRVLLADPGRHDTPAFLAKLAAAGWRAGLQYVSVRRLNPTPTEPAEIAVTLITATRD